MKDSVMPQFGLLKSGEIHRKWDQIPREHNMSVGRFSTKDYYSVWPRILLISLLIVFYCTFHSPWPMQVLVGYFIHSESNYHIQSRRIFLKLFWKYLLFLSQHIPPLSRVLVKTGRLPFSSTAAFSLSPGSLKRGRYEVISPFLLEFSTGSNQSKIQLTSSRDIHGAYRELDWYVGPR